MEQEKIKWMENKKWKKGGRSRVGYLQQQQPGMWRQQQRI